MKIFSFLSRSEYNTNGNRDLSIAHGGHTNIETTLLQYLQKRFGIKTMLDIGCGPGGNVFYARNLDIDCYGIDGDVKYLPKSFGFELVDYRITSSKIDTSFDLGWSVEFVEHIEADYIENYMQDFLKCDRVILTGAPPGWISNKQKAIAAGHVNEQLESYWIKLFEDFGFSFHQNITDDIRNNSILFMDGKKRKSKKQFVRNRGLYFERR